MKWFVYILRCSDNSFYTGISTDPGRRLSDHSTGKGSKYVRSRLPATIVLCWGYKTRGEASKEEYRIKQLTREQKEKLIKGIL